MSAFFEGPDGRPDETAVPLTEIFNLADQLGRADTAPHTESDQS